jgi:hypothetical protein
VISAALVRMAELDGAGAVKDLDITEPDPLARASSAFSAR